jgi:hypothetical protein
MLGLAMIASTGSQARAQLLTVFSLHPNPTALKCLQKATFTPFATVIVGQGALTDDLTIEGGNIKPGLQFDLFTVQTSSLLASGGADPAFKNFGLAWYQTDVEASPSGQIFATLHTILVNQIFGFDAGTTPPLAPTNTFHVGFWFNDPNDAVPCGFNAAKPMPFNGRHKAGPLAMISVPNATTRLGPLCLSPNTSTHPATCNP